MQTNTPTRRGAKSLLAWTTAAATVLVPLGAQAAKASGSVADGCDKAQLAKAMQARAASFRACYESQRMSNPDLKGKLVWKWTINAEGKVQDQNLVEDTLHSAPVAECVGRGISHIPFAKPEAGICVVQWPFVFAPR